jgi:hypothetical protein
MYVLYLANRAVEWTTPEDSAPFNTPAMALEHWHPMPPCNASLWFVPGTITD